MARIGERIPLSIVKEQPFGLYLDGGDLGEVLLPRREVPPSWKMGDRLEVFLYTDSEDRPVATLERPILMPGEFGLLKCVATAKVGAFLDWGLPKDLFVPFREQSPRMQEGRSYFVYVQVDPITDRIMATARISRGLDKSAHAFKPGQKVSLVVYRQTDLGYSTIVDGQHSALLFADAVHQELRIGDKLDGFIQEVRDDGKLSVSLHAQRGQRVSTLEEQILAELDARGGFWPIGDHSSPQQIREEFGVSKRTFKQALGALLKKQHITIEERGIRRA